MVSLAFLGGTLLLGLIHPLLALLHRARQKFLRVGIGRIVEAISAAVVGFALGKPVGFVQFNQAVDHGFVGTGMLIAGRRSAPSQGQLPMSNDFANDDPARMQTRRARRRPAPPSDSGYCRNILNPVPANTEVNGSNRGE